MRTRLTIDLDPTQKQRLQQLARRRQTSVNSLVLETLKARLESEEAQPMPLPSLAGALKKWSNPDLWGREQDAWGDSVAERPAH